ncbi:MAG: hypothetical protein G01um101430_417 [Parcubacteria group bacterium Gr01-1014_30]|nr:MAG: hypothetical protein G01um101430_417 [Parcubacteria group bacterium Gr01-1014_30]
MKEIFPQITLDEKIQFGKPVITGTRVPVEVIVGHIAAGDQMETVMKEYGLTREQILAALKYAAKLVGEELVMAR